MARLGALSLVILTLGTWIGTSFIGPPAPFAPRSVARRAEEEAAAGVVLEEPPSDDEIAKESSLDPRPKRRFRPKREKRGTLCYARRELNEEAERMRPYIEPLLEQQMSLKEITFVLNRRGKELRHLLYKPRVGLPVFTEHKVRRLMRRAKNDAGVRINCFVRPQHLPPNAPGAAYPKYIQDVFAEVPPLGWQEMPEYAHMLSSAKNQARRAANTESRMLTATQEAAEEAGVEPVSEEEEEE